MPYYSIARMNLLRALAWDLSDITTAAELRGRCLDAVYRIVGGELAGLNDVDMVSGTTQVQHWPTEPDLGFNLSTAVTGVIREHPALLHFVATRDPRPFKISDRYSIDQFEKTKVYEHVLGPLKTPHQMVITVTDFPPVGVPPRAVGYAINREKARDFRDSDRDAAAQVQALIWKAYAQFEALERERPHLTKRESQVLDLLAEGHEHKLIGQKLGIRTTTVRGHLQHLGEKLGVEGEKRIMARSFALKIVRPRTP